MFKRLLVDTADLLAPRLAALVSAIGWNIARARKVRDACQACTSLEQKVDCVLSNLWFPSAQKRTEILELLYLLQKRPPLHLCEIGACGGGTVLLFCSIAAPNARVLSLDIGFTRTQLWTYPHFAMGQQRITCLHGDSHAPHTRAKVEAWLGDAHFDFLFIDGDHSLAGVAQDYKMYASLVQPGGIIGFHDIVADNLTRYGAASAHYSGQVPEFWQTMKQLPAATQEFIADPNQDGYGIGVLHVPEASRT
jgi:predicted O-methyltransferase YrrM